MPKPTKQTVHWTSNFEKRVCDYAEWRTAAYALKLAAIAAAERFAQLVATAHTRPDPFEGTEISYVALMLAGLALENLAKARIVMREGSDLAKGKDLAKGQLPEVLNSHGITALMARGQFKISPEEEALVTTLEHYVVWAGRYPVPLFKQHDRPEKAYRGHEFLLVIQLYDRLDHALVNRT